MCTVLLYNRYEDIIPFEFNEQKLTSIVGADGNPWLVAKEVCDILGYAEPSHAVKRHF